MSQDYFRPAVVQMRGYVPGEQPQSGKFIKLNTNENPYPPSARVEGAVQSALGRGLGRYPDPLATAVRLQAAKLHGVPPEWILCGNGSDEILTILTRSLIGEGDWLRLPYPSYILYKNLAEIQGAQSEEVYFRPDWTLGSEFSDTRDRLRLAMLPNPNSPSGTVMTPGAVLEIAERLPCPLLVDEAYADFAEENCIPLVKKCEKVLVSRTLSKSYSLAGLRFGYLIAQPHLIEQFVKVKDSYNCDALSIAAATAALEDEHWLRETRKKIILTRERVTRELRLLDFSVIDSHANFVWCTHVSAASQSLYEGLKRQQILVRYMNYPGWGDGIRVSIGTDEQMDAFLNVLRSLL